PLGMFWANRGGRSPEVRLGVCGHDLTRSRTSRQVSVLPRWESRARRSGFPSRFLQRTYASPASTLLIFRALPPPSSPPSRYNSANARTPPSRAKRRAVVRSSSSLDASLDFFGPSNCLEKHGGNMEKQGQQKRKKSGTRLRDTIEIL